MMTPVERSKYMSLDEVQKLRSFTENFLGSYRWLVIDMALSTGLRVSELAQIQIEDIDLKRGCIKVTRNKRREKRSESLAIGEDLKMHLFYWLRLINQSTGPLFNGQRGPLTAQGLQRIWKRCVKLAGLDPNLSIHAARHTLAVHLLKKTHNLRQVQKQLGHASPTTTANMYADISFEDMQNSVTGLYK
jgi:integrase/recombinase XerD